MSFISATLHEHIMEHLLSRLGREYFRTDWCCVISTHYFFCLLCDWGNIGNLNFMIEFLQPIFSKKPVKLDCTFKLT